MKTVKLISLSIILCSSILYSMPSSTLKDKTPYLQFGDNPRTINSVSVIKAQVPLDANNIESWIQNTGTFDQDIRQTDQPGFMWPKGSGKYAIFTAGLCIGAYYNGSLRMANASYAGEYAPGYIENGVVKTDSRFHLYYVYATDNASTNPDYANWGDMVPFGAPYVDVNDNQMYDPGVDIPGIKDADETVFVCLTDGYPENHSSSEGFSGGTQPLFAEVHFTLWCYNSQGLENLQFMNWNVINKSSVTWTRTHFSVVVDPDLGDENDDYIGCDTSAINKDMAYCYNSDNVDGTGQSKDYGAAPPASGMDFFKSPAIFTGDPNDIIIYYDPPGSQNRIVKTGWRALGLTSFVYFTNTGSGGAACEQDPSPPDEAYRYMTGVKKDGTPWLYPANLQPTKYCYPGDPVTITGWSERGTNGNPNIAIVQNCNGALTGTVSASPPGDRRFIFNSGDSLFNVLPNDTQNIVVGQFVARSTSNLASITALKKVDQTAQSLFNANFAINPSPPTPVVTTSTQQTNGIGNCAITLSWTDISESYLILDSLLQPVGDSSYLKFEGYEIFELSRLSGNYPDFSQPSTINNSVHLLQIYDIVDTIGVIIDTLSAGVVVNGQEQFSPFPVIPFYTAPTPQGFPNTGINRSYTITSTTYPDEHGARTSLIYGQPYRFAVVAYAYRTNPQTKLDRKTITSPLISAIIDIIPQAPLAGSQFTLHNGDTLSTNRRDLGVMPIVKNQAALLTAKYQIQFQAPDTTYNVLRSTDGGNTYQTIKNHLYITPGTIGVSPPDDSTKIIDGISMKVQRIYSSNVGVVKDPGDIDSTQTRQTGWSYTPTGNTYLTGSDSSVNSLPFQNVSMSISWPTNTTFNAAGTALPLDSLRNVTIKYTGYGNGQYALRYLNLSASPPADPSFIPYIVSTGGGFRYQDTREVPFKVYKTDVNGNEVQVMCAFLENNDSLYVTRNGVTEYAGRGLVDGKWDPTNFKTGGIELLYVMGSEYDPDTTSARYTFYKTKNLRINQSQIDIMYVWAPKALTQTSTFTNGDVFNIYPYTVTKPFEAAGVPLTYTFETTGPVIGSSSLAMSQNALNDIRVVPNPFYGVNDLQVNSFTRFVTFRRLPQACTISIYTLSGLMIRQLQKDNDNSSLNWDLNNSVGVPISSGLYIALIDAPGIGSKVIKLAIFTAEERIDF